MLNNKQLTTEKQLTKNITNFNQFQWPIEALVYTRVFISFFFIHIKLIKIKVLNKNRIDEKLTLLKNV